MTKGRFHVRERGVDRGFVTDVAGDAQDARMLRGDQVEGGHLGAVPGERLGDGLADTSPCAGDHCHPTGQALHLDHVPLRWSRQPRMSAAGQISPR